MPEFIYQMHAARKAHGDKVILDDVTLSFFPGAKIGVVGPNGMGKSTLLKIMAGLEEVTNGEARLTPGFSVGILQQEPPLDDEKTVIENIRQAFGDIIAKVERFNAIGEEMASPDADFDALMDEMGKLQDRDRRRQRMGLGQPAFPGHGRAAVPRPRQAGERAFRRRAQARGAVPAASGSARPAAARRAHEPPGRRVGAVAGTVPAARTPARCWRSRTTATFWTTWPNGSARWTAGTSIPTRATTPPTWRQRPHAWPPKVRRMRSWRSAWKPSSPGCVRAPRRARRKARRASSASSRWRPRPAPSKKLDFADIQIPVGPRLGAKVIEAEHLHKAFGERVLIDDLSFTLPQGGIVGVIGPNGVGKSTLFKMIMGQEPLDVRHAQHRRDGEDILRRPEPRGARP